MMKVEIKSYELMNGISIVLMTQAATMWVTPILMRYMNHRVIMLVGYSIGMSGLQCTQYAQSAYAVEIMANVGYGLLNALTQIISVQVAIEWDMKNKGLITGIIVSMRGITPLLLNPFINLIVNPDMDSPLQDSDDVVFHNEIAKRVPYLINSLVLVFSVVGLISIGLCFRTNTIYKQIEDNLDSINIKDGKEGILIQKGTDDLTSNQKL